MFGLGFKGEGGEVITVGKTYVSSKKWEEGKSG